MAIPTITATKAMTTAMEVVKAMVPVVWTIARISRNSHTHDFQERDGSFSHMLLKK